ncbi:hypothetical protein M8C21_014396 [Ambrosia artemisiifolia]|uniref:Cytochrome b5 heme-binding domain-containing protein n=1 Tax=Ambrosia artemisiifolia TaxID=4212 RepID=A0AAD5D5W1_AMBAR|nr:hypothetical protein M8C21_014396 [Ambrosia artemisiifolia]
MHMYFEHDHEYLPLFVYKTTPNQPKDMIMNIYMTVFYLAHVSQHNSSKDCWVIINPRVYDVTKFLNDHPCGDNVLLEVVGKNASEEFEDAGHGSAARLMLDEYYVGEADLLTPFHGISTTTKLKEETHLKKQKITE